MQALQKNVVNDLTDLIEQLKKREMHDLAEQATRILKNINSFLDTDDEALYKGILNKSLAEVWENEKDDDYNAL